MTSIYCIPYSIVTYLSPQVHIYTHHPSTRVLYPWQREFSKIVMRYENSIRGIFVGHTHSDEPLIWRNENGDPSVMAYINPSFTSRKEKMPEFRIFTFGKHVINALILLLLFYRSFILDGGYPGASWQLLDIDTYYTPIEDYDDPNVPPFFDLLYNSREVKKDFAKV